MRIVYTTWKMTEMFSDVNRPCQMYVRSKLRPTPSGKQRYPQAVKRQLIVYLVVSWCLCESIYVNKTAQKPLQN